MLSEETLPSETAPHLGGLHNTTCPYIPAARTRVWFFSPSLAFAAISTELLAYEEPPACLGVSPLFDFTWNPDFPAVSIPWAKYLLRIVHL